VSEYDDPFPDPNVYDCSCWECVEWTSGDPDQEVWDYLDGKEEE